MSTETTLEAYKNDREERLGQPIDRAFLETANKFTDMSVKNKYFYNWEFMGVPVIQFPQDLMAISEIINDTKPDHIVETGLAWGGSNLFYANQLGLLDQEYDYQIRHVTSVEKKILPGVRDVLENKYANLGWVEPYFEEGSSTDKKVFDRVKRGIDVNKSQRVMVCLDSAHWESHVAQELELYAPLVSVGCYLVVFDTFVEYRNPDLYKDHTCQPGNSPATAVKKFLENHPEFEVDKRIDRKTVISSNIGGYLRRVR